MRPVERSVVKSNANALVDIIEAAVRDARSNARSLNGSALPRGVRQPPGICSRCWNARLPSSTASRRLATSPDLHQREHQAGAWIRAERIPRESEFLARTGSSGRPATGGGGITRLIGNGVHSLEYRFRRRDGSYCWVKDEQHLIKDADGNPWRSSGHGATSPRASRRRKRRKPRIEARATAAASPAVIYSFEARGEFRPTFVSENFKLVWGTTPRSTWKARISGDVAFTPTILPSVEAEFPKLFGNGRHTVEYRFLKKEAGYCWVSDEWRLILDEAGTARGGRFVERHHGAPQG